MQLGSIFYFGHTDGWVEYRCRLGVQAFHGTPLHANPYDY